MLRGGGRLDLTPTIARWSTSATRFDEGAGTSPLRESGMPTRTSYPREYTSMPDRDGQAFTEPGLLFL